MASLAVVSGAEATRTFERAGWQRARQEGSHVSLAKSGLTLIFPFLFTGNWIEVPGAS
jgi:predicted RNA binding protein YcfA (HicA-like mRNA interferase family)